MIEGFEQWMLERGKRYSYLTRRAYLLQVGKFLREYHAVTLGNLTRFGYAMPNPCRIMALRAYLRYLESIGKFSSQLRQQFKDDVKAKQSDRLHIQTLKLRDGRKLIASLFESNEKELAIISMLIYDTGARVRGVLKLRNRDIEEDDGNIYVTLREKREKKQRRIITHDTYVRIKSCLLNDDMPSEAYLFFKDNGKNKERVTDKELDAKYYELWSRLKNFTRQNNAGIGISWHWMRRGAGVAIYQATKKDIVAAAAFIGDTVGVTQRYLKIEGQNAENVIKQRRW